VCGFLSACLLTHTAQHANECELLLIRFSARSLNNDHYLQINPNTQCVCMRKTAFDVVTLRLFNYSPVHFLSVVVAINLVKQFKFLSELVKLFHVCRSFQFFAATLAVIIRKQLFAACVCFMNNTASIN
jgi:hypothetical protein